MSLVDDGRQVRFALAGTAPGHTTVDTSGFALAGATRGHPADPRRVSCVISGTMGLCRVSRDGNEACWLALPGPQGSSVTLAAGDLEDYVPYGDFLRL